MIDLHCHILPGVDDGAPDVQTAIRMAKIAAGDGIRTIVATPHIKDILHPIDKLQGLVSHLNFMVADQEIPVEILLGGDVFVQVDAARLKDYTINKSRYILIEFPHNYLPPNSKEIFFRLAAQGFLPIITHPERNAAIIENPNLLLEMLHGNVFVQITAGSLTGEFGRDEKACATYLLRKNAVHFLASDAHSTGFRKPILSEGLKRAGKIIGKERALRLVQENPQAVLQDKMLLDC